jgi:uncharacterized nucleotidyltransferase DUF6036
VASPVADLLAAFGSVADRLGVPWYLFGAQAALLHGAARLTADVDVTVDLGTRPTRDLVDGLRIAGFELRVRDADEFVERTRVIPLVHVSTGLPLDVVLAGPGPEALFLARVQHRDVEGISVPVASPEDLIVMKLLAGRSKDLDDVRAILTAHRNDLDLVHLRETVRALEAALDQSDLSPLLEQLLSVTGGAKGGG